MNIGILTPWRSAKPTTPGTTLDTKQQSSQESPTTLGATESLRDAHHAAVLALDELETALTELKNSRTDSTSQRFPRVEGESDDSFTTPTDSEDSSSYLTRTFGLIEQKLASLQAEQEKGEADARELVNDSDCAPALHLYVRRVADAATRRRIAALGYKEKFDALDDRLNELREAADRLEPFTEISPAPDALNKSRAALLLAKKILSAARSSIESIGKRRAELAASVKNELPTKSAPVEKRIASQFKKLGKSVLRVISLYSETRAAFHKAKKSTELAQELEIKRVTEPQKPTAEEVGRYLKQLLEWCREQLPAQRKAGEDVQRFRELHATLERDLAAAARLLARLSYLENRLTAPNTLGLLVASSELLKNLSRVCRGWRFHANHWATKRFDRSEPITVTSDDELTSIERLELSVRNVGIAAAGKVMARVKYDSVKDVGIDKLPETPSFSLSHIDQIDSMLARAETHLSELTAAELENERRRAEKEVAWDAYQTSIERTRLASVASLKLAGEVERLLTRKPSDEMRVALNRVYKLHKLHGSGRSY